VNYGVSMNPIIPRILSNMYCKGCPIFENKKYANRIDARNRALKLNAQYAQYIPHVIKILFIGESPPQAFIKHENAYFYASGPERPRSLAYYMNQVLFGGEVTSKEDFFKKFKEHGFYFIDMVKCPIGRFNNNWERKAIIEHCAKYLSEELQTLKFEKAIFMGKTTFKHIKKYLKLDFPHHVIPLPFRNNKNVIAFKTKLARILAQGEENEENDC